MPITVHICACGEKVFSCWVVLWKLHCLVSWRPLRYYTSVRPHLVSKKRLISTNPLSSRHVSWSQYTLQDDVGVYCLYLYLRISSFFFHYSLKPIFVLLSVLDLFTVRPRVSRFPLVICRRRAAAGATDFITCVIHDTKIITESTRPWRDVREWRHAEKKIKMHCYVELEARTSN